MKIQVTVNELDDEDELLRYMDFAKFIRLIHNKKLHFPRADCFDDKYEGYYTKQLYEMSKNSTIEANGKSSSKGLYELTEIIRKSSYVSCWMKSQHESMAHWDIYGEKNSVAIKTSVGELKKQLNKPSANIGIYTLMNKEIVSVKYIDHHAIDNKLAKELLTNLISPLKHKNLAFKYEEEVRAIYSHLHQPLAWNEFNSRLGKGFDINIQPNELISRIIVSPKADRWFHTLVTDLMVGYGLSGQVERSKLHITPFEEVFSEK